MYIYNYIYFYNVETQMDMNKAIEYFELAADKDYAPAQNHLGMLWEKGVMRECDATSNNITTYSSNNKIERKGL